MSRGPLQRLTDEEIDYLTSHVRYDITHDKMLYNTFYSNRPLREWLERRILMTADYFKVRYDPTNA